MLTGPQIDAQGVSGYAGQMSMNTFELWHTYNGLADQNLAPRLRCDHGHVLQLVASKNYDPQFLCYTCNTTTTPGAAMVREAQSWISQSETYT